MQLRSVNASHANSSNAGYARPQVGNVYHASVRVFDSETDDTMPEPMPFGFSNKASYGSETHAKSAVRFGFGV